jgi:hypothetical protein
MVSAAHLGPTTNFRLHSYCLLFSIVAHVGGSHTVLGWVLAQNNSMKLI